MRRHNGETVDHLLIHCELMIYGAWFSECLESIGYYQGGWLTSYQGGGIGLESTLRRFEICSFMCNVSVVEGDE